MSPEEPGSERPDWETLDPADPELFDRLRALNRFELWISVPVGTGRYQVPLPAAHLTLRAEAIVDSRSDRIGLSLPDWSTNDLAWLSRRKGRGRPDFWQVALERRTPDGPALVFYAAAEADGIELRLSRLPQNTTDSSL